MIFGRGGPGRRGRVKVPPQPTSTPPLNPGSITATPGVGQITIAQQSPATGGSGTLTRQLEHSETGSGGWTPIANALPFVHSGAAVVAGDTDYYRLAVSDGTTTAYTQVVNATPQAAGGGSAQLIASLDFKNGFGVFDRSTASAQRDITIVDDPTGLWGGKVGRFYFKRLVGEGSRDINNNVFMPATLAALSNPNGLTWGERLYFRGEFTLPGYPLGVPLDPTQDQRKLIYFMFGDWDNVTDSVGNSTRTNLVVHSWGRTDKTGMDLAMVYGKRTDHVTEYGLAFVPFGVKHLLEVEWKTNTHDGTYPADANPDGWLKVWLNGVLVKDRQNIRVAAPAENKPTRCFWFEYGIGSQEQWLDEEPKMENVRYWNNIEFWTQRPV